MTIREQIDRILAARKEKGKELEARLEAWKKLKESLYRGTSSLVMESMDIKDDKLREQYGRIFNDVDASEVELLKIMDQVVTAMGDGVKRFNRDYISIATVGKERQGKSQFLQSLGDLDDEIIPAYDATSCTGATSIICNAAEMPKGSVRATITFRQPSELLDIVRPYIMEIDPAYLNNYPLKFEDIGYIRLNYLASKVEKGNANQATALKHLTNIVRHFSEIQELFGSSPISLTDPQLIKTYVAQNNGKDVDSPEAEFYYKYLAVARADIYCPFFVDIGRVHLVDTVGIGDTKYGIEDMMLNTVDRECDAAIVVTRPISGVQESDIELYNSLRDKFRDRDTGLWLFYLVNHYRGQNDKTVQSFLNGITESKFSVAGSSVVDVSDQDAVRDDFTIPVLNTLMKNMDAIDGAYLKSVYAKEAAAKEKLRAFLAKLPALSPVNTHGLLGMEAAEKGKRCFNRMTAELSETMHHWSLEREKPNTKLWNSVQAILNNLDNIVPTPEKIKAIVNSTGLLTGEDAWEKMLHYVRNEITDRFIAIDDVLEEETRQFKCSLVRTLYQELRQLSSNEADGGSQDEDCDMIEWLKTMMDEILTGNEKYAQIRKGFDFLYRFEFNTRAQLIQEVRRQMYIINPLCAEYAKPTITFQRSNCENAIHFYLTSRMSVIEDELRYHLAKLYRTPNQAFYAAAEEFYDRLTFAIDLSGGYLISMADVWGAFFQEFSSKLWKEDVERFDVVNRLIAAYNEMVSGLRAFLEGAGAAAEKGAE